MSASTATSPREHEPSTGETTTYLFTDIEASTAAWETSSDMPERLDRHLRILEDQVESFGGETFSWMGDGIAAAFPSAAAGVRAAVAAQRALPESGLRARMGLHTGEARRVGDDHRGRAVNRAARIMALGRGGQILVSDLCAALIRSGPDPVDLVDLGLHRLRGLVEPERLWQVADHGLGDPEPPVRSLGALPGAPPRPRATLLGRERETARLGDLIGRAPIVTVTGPGGVGKTLLTLDTVRSLPTRTDVRWVELAHLPPGAATRDVATAIALGLGVLAPADPIELVADSLDGAVLVVDNCEHVIDGAAEVIGALADRGRDLTVVATSREPLGVDGEHLVRVGPLRAGPAADLFRRRAEAAGADGAAVDDGTTREILRHLDGLPLAIELVAARAGTLGPAALLDALRRRSPVAARRRGRADRHATIEATIAWSYDLLDPSARRLLSRIAVFPSGVDLDAVVAVGSRIGLDARGATEVVASLVDRNVVIADPQEHGVRFRLLETMRTFLLARLDAAGERSGALLDMAEWVASITDVPLVDACGEGSLRAAVRLEREADTWRDAMLVAARSGHGELVARLCGPPTAFFLLGRHDLAEPVAGAVDLCGDDPRRRLVTLCALMVSTAGSADPRQLQDWADEMVAVDTGLSGLGALMQWLARLRNGDVATAVTTCLAAADDPRVPPATREMLLAIAVLDRFSLTTVDVDRVDLIDRALAVAEATPVPLTRVSARLGAAWALAATEPERCVDLVRRAMADLGDVPALTRLTLPGSAFRLLAGLDPRTAARGLIDLLDADEPGRSPVELVPLAYARALLARVGHPAASTLSPSPPNTDRPSMIDVVEEARRLASRTTPQARRRLEADVRAALGEIARDDHRGSLPVLDVGPISVVVP